MTSNRAQRPAAVPAPIIECIPNFSEGRDAAVVDRIADAMATVAEVAVLGVTLDSDHNRSVITIAGPPQAVMLAAIRGVEQAARSIDL
ncbi:MAG TPA: hypothetical protein VEQ63_12265, partial [Bryobacteraceae bacterium]|nr:hypothetical protein [Bryobacteraceae bacterium]